MDPNTAELRLFLCDHLQSATNDWARKKGIRRRDSILRRESEANFDQAVRMLDELDRMIAHATADDDLCTECGVSPATHIFDPTHRLCDECFGDLYEDGPTMREAKRNRLLCQLCRERPMLMGNMEPDACDECATRLAKAAFDAAVAAGALPADAAEGLWREEELLEEYWREALFGQEV